MQRLMLAALALMVTLWLLSSLAKVFRRTLSEVEESGPDRILGDTMQKLSFFLLCALIIYVATIGAS